MKNLNIGIIIVFALLCSSCGPSQSEIDRMAANAYEDGYRAGVDFGVAQSNEREYQRGLTDGQIIGEGIGYGEGFKDGQYEGFVTDVLDLVEIHWSHAVVILGFLLLIGFLFEVFRRYVLKSMIEWMHQRMVDIRFLLSPLHGAIQKIAAQKDKWEIQTQNIEKSNATFTVEITVQNERIEKYKEFINGGMPTDQETIAQRDICIAQKRISDCKKLIEKGRTYLEDIRKLLNGLDMLTYRAQTVLNVNIQDTFEDFSDLEHNIKSFLRWDIGSLGENDDLDNEYYFTAS